MNRLQKILVNWFLVSNLVLILPDMAFASQDTKNAASSSEVAEMMKAKPPRNITGIPLPAGEYQPWRLVRQLQLAQDDIVRGYKGAQKNYRNQLINVSKLLISQTSEIWQNERNLNAIAVYVLIGGNIAVGKKAMMESTLDQDKKLPLKAALSFSGRKFREAHILLTELDHTKLPASMSAQFALAKSMVTSLTNLDQAGKYLDDARRLAPGTLIEEASLRRSTRIAGEQRKFKSRSFALRFY